MAVHGVLIALQASRDNDRGVTESELTTALEITPEDIIDSINAPGTRWSGGSIYFPIVDRAQFSKGSEGSEAFDNAVRVLLAKVADFLNRRSASVFEKLRSENKNVRVFVEVRMDQDQMEFDFPPDFLLACATKLLGIYLISNDISASEILEARRAQSDE